MYLCFSSSISSFVITCCPIFYKRKEVTDIHGRSPKPYANKSIDVLSCLEQLSRTRILASFTNLSTDCRKLSSLLICPPVLFLTLVAIDPDKSIARPTSVFTSLGCNSSPERAGSVEPLLTDVSEDSTNDFSPFFRICEINLVFGAARQSYSLLHKQNLSSCLLQQRHKIPLKIQ